MKANKVLLTLALSGLILITGDVFGQEGREMTRTEHQAYDSMQTAKHNEMVTREQKEDDAERITDAKRAQRETSEKAKETRRIDREASRAAREARMALKSEKKAQKARIDADKQSKKADRAKDISDEN